MQSGFIFWVRGFRYDFNISIFAFKHCFAIKSNLFPFNMRLILMCLFLFCLVSAKVQSQSDSSNRKPLKHGILVGTFLSAVPNNFNYFIGYSVSKGRSRISTGLVFGRKLFLFPGASHTAESKILVINGMNAAYQFFPNPKGKRYNLFFQFETTFQRFSNSGSDSKYSYGQKHFKATEVYFSNFIGYGISFRFFRHFEINHNIGFGYLVDKIKFNENSYRSYSRISGNTRLSLIYTFP